MHLRDGVSAKSQPRKMQCQPMIYSVFEEGGRASRNAYKPNGFSFILGTFLTKWRQNHPETIGFIRVCALQFWAYGDRVFTKE